MPQSTQRIDPNMQYAALQERVHGLGQQFLNFEQTTTRSFQQVEAALAGLSAEVRAGGKTQWQTIVTAVGVIVTILGALGTLAYLPVKSGMDQLSGEVRILRGGMVPRSELVDRWRRNEKDLQALEAGLRRIEDRSVLRVEHEEKWRANDSRFGNLQRQIDEIRRGPRNPKAGDDS
jgi:hypothetical protein